MAPTRIKLRRLLKVVVLSASVAIAMNMGFCFLQNLRQTNNARELQVSADVCFGLLSDGYYLAKAEKRLDGYQELVYRDLWQVKAIKISRWPVKADDLKRVFRHPRFDTVAIGGRFLLKREAVRLVELFNPETGNELVAVRWLGVFSPAEVDVFMKKLTSEKCHSSKDGDSVGLFQGLDNHNPVMIPRTAIVENTVDSNIILK